MIVKRQLKGSRWTKSRYRQRLTPRKSSTLMRVEVFH